MVLLDISVCIIAEFGYQSAGWNLSSILNMIYNIQMYFLFNEILVFTQYYNYPEHTPHFVMELAIFQIYKIMDHNVALPQSFTSFIKFSN